MLSVIINKIIFLFGCAKFKVFFVIFMLSSVSFSYFELVPEFKAIVKTKDKKGLNVRLCPDLNCKRMGLVLDDTEIKIDDKIYNDKWVKITNPTEFRNFYVHGDYLDFYGNKPIQEINLRDYYGSFTEEYSENKIKTLRHLFKNNIPKKILHSQFVNKSTYKYIFENTNGNKSFAICGINKIGFCNFLKSVDSKPVCKPTDSVSDYAKKEVFRSWYLDHDVKIHDVEWHRYSRTKKSLQQRPKLIMCASNYSLYEAHLKKVKSLGLYESTNASTEPIKIDSSDVKVFSDEVYIKIKYKVPSKRIFKTVIGDFAKRVGLTLEITGEPYELVFSLNRESYLYNGDNLIEIKADSDIKVNDFFLKKGQSLKISDLYKVKQFKKHFNQAVINKHYGFNSEEKFDETNERFYFNPAGLKLNKIYKMSDNVEVEYRNKTINFISKQQTKDVSSGINVYDGIYTIPTIRYDFDERDYGCQSHGNYITQIPKALENKYNLTLDKVLKFERVEGALFEIFLKKKHIFNTFEVPKKSKVYISKISCSDEIKLHSVVLNESVNWKNLSLYSGDRIYFFGNEVDMIVSKGKEVYRKIPINYSNLKVGAEWPFCLKRVGILKNSLELKNCDSFYEGFLDDIVVVKYYQVHDLSVDEGVITLVRGDKKEQYNLSDLTTIRSAVINNIEYLIPVARIIKDDSYEITPYFKKKSPYSLFKTNKDNGYVVDFKNLKYVLKGSKSLCQSHMHEPVEEDDDDIIEYELPVRPDGSVYIKNYFLHGQSKDFCNGNC